MKRLLLPILLMSLAVAGQSTLTINTGTSYQTFENWEATGQAGHDSNAITNAEGEYPSGTFPSYKTNLINAMLDFGINRVRLEFNFADVNATGYDVFSNNAAIQPSTASAGQWHYDRFKRFMDALGSDYKTAAAAQGEEARFTICLVDFRSAGYAAENSSSEYAFLVNRIVQEFYDTYGFRPYAIEANLETDAGTNSNWTAAKLANGIVAADALLVSNGHTGIKWIAPSVTNAGNFTTWWADMQTANAGVAALVDERSYHVYSGNDGATRDAIKAAAYPKTAMLEFIAANTDTLYNDLTRGYVSSWQQYTIAFPYNGWIDSGSEYFEVNTSTWAVTLTARAKWLRHTFKYVRQGAIRKGVTVTGTATDTTAFVNANNTYVVVTKPTASGTITVKNLPAGTYGINYSYGSDVNSSPSTFNSSFANQTITAGQDVVFTMTGAGIATVYNVNYLQTSGTRGAASGAVKISGGARLQ